MTRFGGATLFLVVLLSMLAGPAYGFFGEVILSEGGDKAFLKRIEARLSNVVTHLEARSLATLRADFTPDGFAAAESLLARVPMENSRPVHESRLISRRDGMYEVRGIRVRVGMGDTPGSAYQYLVFELDADGRIADLRFSVDADHYERVIDEHLDLTDLARRQQILQFIEIYRTAHNRKDIEYLRKVYSDHAIIIVGRVLDTEPDSGDMLQSSFRSEPEIRFVRRSRQEYLDGLERVFARNDFVKIEFEKVEVVRHHQDPDLYGVTLKQEWKSSTYSDSGWLFLLVDFRDRDQPLIHVRSWQPRPFADGTVMSLYDFQLIE